MEKFFLGAAALLIIGLGVYVMARPVFISDKLKKFYSNYPLVRYAGDKQLTGRSGLIRIAGVVLVILGIVGLLECLAGK